MERALHQLERKRCRLLADGYHRLLIGRRWKRQVGPPPGDLSVFAFDNEHLWKFGLGSILHGMVCIYLDGEGFVVLEIADSQVGSVDDISYVR